MAHYAKISNDEFTISERARLIEAQSEKGVIEANNRASEEYATLKDAYDNSFTSSTCCLLYTSPSPRDRQKSRMPSSA